MKRILLMSAMVLCASWTNAVMAASIAGMPAGAPPPPPPVPAAHIEMNPGFQLQPEAPSETKALENYLIKVQWEEKKQATNALMISTTEGRFSLDTIQGKAMINNNEVPITVDLSGDLTVLSADKVRVRISLKRAVPYITGTTMTPSGPMSNYQQMRVGMETSVTVTVGKPTVIQSDSREEITILVKKEVR